MRRKCHPLLTRYGKVMLVLFWVGVGPCVAFPKPDELTTETLLAAAQYYLFCASGTTQGIVTVPLVGVERRKFQQGPFRRMEFHRMLIWWPGKTIDSEEEKVCRRAFVSAHREVDRRIALATTFDQDLFDLCNPLSAQRSVCMQYSVLNERLLEHLHKRFPNDPPVGVHIEARLGAIVDRLHPSLRGRRR